MGKIGKISVIPKESSNNASLQTMQNSLSQKGLTRVPGTGVFRFPYKELDNQYRTGLDPNAKYIQRIQDPLERELELERIVETKKRIQAALGDVDLGPRSSFWNYSLSTSTNDALHVQPVKLMDGDNLFDLSITSQELTFSWLRVHPTIASSLQAYENGEYPADTQFYVVDDDMESKVVYNKKLLINNAIIKFSSMTPSKRRKISRLLGLPVTEDSKDELVYNLVDNLLKQTEFKKGKYVGLSTIEVFTRFADMQENLLHIKDLVQQALTHSIYRTKPGGGIYEGEYEIAKDEDELIKFLINDNNQDELLTLEGKLKMKKLAAI